MKKLLVLLLALPALSCSSNDSSQREDLSHLKTCVGNRGCDDCVVIDEKLYNGTLTDNYRINGVSLIGDCLEITFSSSGCSGDTWETELIDRGAIAETNPGQRFLRMKLTNKEVCEAYITRSISFDIAPLQVPGEPLNLNIAGWEEQVLYSY